MSLLLELQNSINCFDLEKVNKILNPSKTTVDVTFWGTRVINIDGYGKKSVAINQIASLINILLSNHDHLRTEKYLIPQEKEEAAYFITKKLIDFYNSSDEKIDEASRITQIFVAFFEWWPIRYLIEGNWPSIRGKMEMKFESPSYWPNRYSYHRF